MPDPTIEPGRARPDTPLLERRWFIALAVVLLLAVFAVQALSAAAGQSLHYDEPVLITSGFASYRPHPEGYAFWEIESGPLLWRMVTLPLLFTPVDVEVNSPDWGDLNAVSTRFMFENALPVHRITMLARFFIMPVSLLLGLLIFLWARELYGTAAGLFSLAIFSLSPNLIAYAPIIGNDMAVSLAMFAAVYLFYRWRRKPTTRRLIVLGVGLGLALQAKMSVLAALPVLFILSAVDTVYEYRGAGTPETGLLPDLFKRGRKTIGVTLLLILIGGIVLWAGYDFAFQPVISPYSTSTGEHAILASLADRLNMPRESLYSLVENTRIPLGNFVRGFRTHLGRTSGEHAYLLGQYSVTGWWYYFPLAFAVKAPLPFLILIGLALLSLILGWRPDAHLRDDWFLLIPPLFFLLSLLFIRKNIGIRYLLPIWPFLIVFAGRLVTPGLWRTRRWLAVPLALLLGWQVAEAARIYPHHIAYFNEAAGGPDQGWRVLADSNIEWGEGLFYLRDYMEEHGLESVRLAYFGRVDPARYGINYEPLRPGAEVSGTVVISITKLLGVFGSPDDYAWLWAYEPVDKIGYGLWVYDIE